METWGIIISVIAIVFGVAGASFLFWGWNLYNRGKKALVQFVLAAVGGAVFGGLLYLGGKLGLLW